MFASPVKPYGKKRFDPSLRFFRSLRLFRRIRDGHHGRPAAPLLSPSYAFHSFSKFSYPLGGPTFRCRYVWTSVDDEFRWAERSALSRKRIALCVIINGPGVAEAHHSRTETCKMYRNGFGLTFVRHFSAVKSRRYRKKISPRPWAGGPLLTTGRIV